MIYQREIIMRNEENKAVLKRVKLIPYTLVRCCPKCDIELNKGKNTLSHVLYECPNCNFKVKYGQIEDSLYGEIFYMKEVTANKTKENKNEK